MTIPITGVSLVTGDLTKERVARLEMVENWVIANPSMRCYDPRRSPLVPRGYYACRCECNLILCLKQRA